ncbi:sacsin N-terminal ATP-binding-like domain-containing protein [Streptomyces polyrhachis]|uniref:Sacsin N-terminal ATP-binding-like domain-containing protein n=1 Tax=Streptomyces polyrhachis TaxID=1282885 RepID=A0ABW2GGS6_9ACTN
MSHADPFRTAQLRTAALDAWAASAARLREDANAEEDLALGGYRDRLVVELAQNAADAAVRAGVAGRLRLVLDDEGLTAANTGAPLDAAGAASLSTLRASAKRDGEAQGSVGRFGVGFNAVLAVTDAPSIVRSDGAGVRWSRAEARAAVQERAAEVPELAEELARRGGHVPALRLPLPATGEVPEGYDTAVVLPFRDAAARELAHRLAAGVDDALLLALPGLAEVVVETPAGSRTLTRTQEGAHVVITDGGRTTRWRVESESGPLDARLLADRPVEERLRPYWSVTWAVPVAEDGSPARPRTAEVLHAPTPTDEPLGLPALLIATLPLEPTRRHVAPGPLTDHLLDRAAETYAKLLRDWRPVHPAVLDLVPAVLGRGGIDGELRARILRRLPEVPFLAPALTPANEEGEDAPGLRPRDAELIEGANAGTTAVLAELFPALLPAGQERRPELRTLEVARLTLGEAIDRLAGVEREPSWWRRLYEALAGTDPDRLAGLPVPLAGGGTALGPRQTLLPQPGTDAAAFAGLGLRIVHPDAAHPLLARLGATPATARAILTTPQVRAAVAASLDEGDDTWFDDEPAAPTPEALADLVLTLVRDAGLQPGDEPWLAALALPDEDGELAPAGELLLPGSPFAQLVREGELAACDAALAERWGRGPLTAVGVQADFALVRAADVVLDPDELEPREGDYPEPDDAGLLDAVDVWCEDVLDGLDEQPVPPVLTELTAVRDLDLVADDKWPQALALLSRPPLRDALTAPARVLLADGTTRRIRPYTAWWLRDHPILAGRRPAGLRALSGDPLLAGLYETADTSTVHDEEVLRALGVRTSAAALLAEPGGAAELLTRLADPGLPVTPAQLHGLNTLLADLDPEQVTLPDEVRAVRDGRTVVVGAAGPDAPLIADAPDLLPLAAGRALVPVRPERAAELAELLQLRRLSEVYEAPVDASAGQLRDVPEEIAALLGPATPAAYLEHAELTVDGVELDWRRTPDGTLHAATLEGVAAALAWAGGQWGRRFEVAALLEDPQRTAELARDRWFD